MRRTLFALLSTVIAAALASSALSPRAAAAGAQWDLTGFRIVVTGEVRHPGPVTLTDSTMTVLDALAAAGSPLGNASEDIIVTHLASAGVVEERLTINLSEVKAGRAVESLTLKAGDTIEVQAAHLYYISGFVKFPGTYRLGVRTTVSQALSLAGGLSKGGNEHHIRISRVVNGQPGEIAAAMNDVVLANDQIKVQKKMF